MATANVVIPYTPRPLQKVVHARGKRFGAMVCHRRFGKTVLGVNDLNKGAMTCRKERPRFAYIAPTYRQAKAIAWDMAKYYAKPIPGVTFNESELRIDYPNGGQVRLYGADSPDALRGLYLDGVVVDEYGLCDADLFGPVLRPALADRQGWALFLGTPNGKNQFYDILEYAKAHEDWFYASYPVSQTGLIPEDELAAARTVMTEDEYRAEFECSFEAAVRGAIYGTELDRARADGRITSVPYDPILPVDTTWDLGMGDATAIVFSQKLRSGEVRIIDYYEASGEGLPHYIAKLKEKGYVYGDHTAPHDINVRELASGRSRKETAQSLGIKFKMAPRVGLEDGIHALRMLFPRLWFDEVRAKPLLEALQHYRRSYNQKLQEFTSSPVHDWSSHCADAMRYLAVSLKPVKTDDARRSLQQQMEWGQTGWMQM
jgi:phage terminase large subunit